MQSDNIIGIDGKSKVSLSWRGSTEDILSFRYLGVIWGYFASIRHLKVESTLTLKKLTSGLEMKMADCSSLWGAAAGASAGSQGGLCSRAVGFPFSSVSLRNTTGVLAAQVVHVLGSY